MSGLIEPLTTLHQGMTLLVGGDKMVQVSQAIADRFQAGDALIVVPDTG